MTLEIDNIEVAELKKAVEDTYDRQASICKCVYVTETFQNQTVWEGIVYVFFLVDHPQAEVCYAWSAPVEGSDKRRLYTVLGKPPINSAQDAVRAAIVAEHRTNRK